MICADWSLRRGKRIAMLETLEEAGTHARRARGRVAPRDAQLADVVTRQPGDAGAARGRLRAAVPARLHVRDDRQARRARSTCRAAFSSRSRARPPTRPTSTPGDRVHFATDMGWIMGPWTVVGGGAVGATIVFAEGAPDWPDDRLWRLIEREQVTMLGALADAHPRADPAGRAARGPVVAARARARRASRGTPIRTVALRARRRRRRVRSSTSRAAPRSAPASSRR